MKYLHLLRALQSMTWGITPEAFNGLFRAIEGDLTQADFEIFHHGDKFELENLIIRAGQKVDSASYTYVAGRIGMLLMDGPTVPRASNFGKSSGVVSINGYVSEFDALDNSPQIDHIITLYDTPGGSTTGTSEAAARVKAARTPTTAFVYGMCCSAGYWVASAHDRIISVDTGVSGSIGTLMSFRADEDKETTIVSSQSPQKNADPSTKEGAAQYQAIVDGLTEIFVNTVAQNRGVTTEKVLNDFGKGGILTAQGALSVGMIDGISTFENLLNELQSDTRTAVSIAAINTPAIAGKGITVMNEFEKFLAENPAAKAAFDTRLKEQFDAGFAERQGQLAEAVKVSAPLFSADSKYPPKLRARALRVFEGTASAEVLEIGMEMWDENFATKAVEGAQGEGEELGGTAAPKPVLPKAEAGSISDEKAEAAEIKRLQASLGVRVVK